MQVRSLGGEDLLEEGMQPAPVFLPGESHVQRILVGYIPQGCKELDCVRAKSLQSCLTLWLISSYKYITEHGTLKRH